MLTHDASPKTSTARKTAGRVAARKRRACQWEWPGGRAIEKRKAGAELANYAHC